MKKTTLPGNTTPVSQVVLGADWITLDNYDTSSKLMDIALANGINSIDTAHIYCGGDSERAIGKWMEERNNRDQVYIITKCSHHNADRNRVTPFDISADLADSLIRLRTNYIDMYLLHRDDPSKPVGPIMDALHQHCKAGSIRAFGGSNWTHQRIVEANEYASSKGQTQMTASSPNYSLCDQVNDPWGPGCVTVSGQANAGARDYYKQNDISLFPYSSLGRGVMSGRVTRENYKELLDGAALAAYAYEVNFKRLDRVRELANKNGYTVAQIAMAYLLNQPLKIFPLVGLKSEQEVKEIVESTSITLTQQECNWLENG